MLDQFKRSGGKPHARQIKDWIRSDLSLSEDFSIMVTELKCSEPGCPPIETVVAILGSGSEQYQQKLHLPIEEVTESDIREIGSKLRMQMMKDSKIMEECDDHRE
jgi:hypothetical protein